MTDNLEKQLELEFCIFMRNQTCMPDDSEIEDFCCLNNLECPKFIEYKRIRNEGDIKRYGI